MLTRSTVRFERGQVTDDMLEAASQLFTENYGIWGRGRPFVRPGKLWSEAPAFSLFNHNSHLAKVWISILMLYGLWYIWLVPSTQLTNKSRHSHQNERTPPTRPVSSRGIA